MKSRALKERISVYILTQHKYNLQDKLGGIRLNRMVTCSKKPVSPSCFFSRIQLLHRYLILAITLYYFSITKTINPHHPYLNIIYIHRELPRGTIWIIMSRILFSKSSEAESCRIVEQKRLTEKNSRII